MDRRSLLKFVGLSALTGAIPEPMTGEVPTQPQRPGAAFNQLGYLPSSAKIATVPLLDAANPSGASFQLIAESSGKASNQPVFHGTLSAPQLDEASGDRASLADFSAFTTPGLYRFVANGRSSAPFQISKNAYRDALRLTMRSYYGQRCGCAVDLGGGYRHAACHLAGAYHATSGRSGALANHGGWHDAGDYGRYVVNSGITTGTLLWAWELYPDTLRNLSLDIPESNGKTPGYLAEIRWNLDWMLSLQDEDGGVWHKQTSEQFCGFILPEQDTLVSYIIGTGSAPYKSTDATADLAAVAAIAARCYSAYDSVYAAQCLTAASRAWTWASRHPNVTFTNPPGIGTGGYDDRRCNDALLWAAAELWRTTADPQYERAFLEGAASLPPERAIHAPSWSDVAPMAYWSYLLSDRKPAVESSDAVTAAALKDQARKQTIAAAASLVTRSKTSGYGNTLATSDYTWGSNSVAANQSLLLLIANHLQPDPAAVEAALGNLHYLLGRNCFGVSWVTQLGTNPFQHPHHRPSAADGIAAPWPGLLSGGPNARPADQVAHTLPKQPSMRMWIDDERAYSMNEIAINWNAPLVFLLAAANA